MTNSFRGQSLINLLTFSTSMNRLSSVVSICALVTALAGVATLAGCQPRVSTKQYIGTLKDGSPFQGAAICNNSGRNTKVLSYNLTWGTEPYTTQVKAESLSRDTNKNGIADPSGAMVTCPTGSMEVAYFEIAVRTAPRYAGPCNTDHATLKHQAETLALEVCALGKEQLDYSWIYRRL